MADVNPEVLDMVVRALQKDPSIRSTDLQGRAAEMDRSIGSLSGRQFHARYGLQARKRLAGSRRGKKGRKKAAGRKGAGRKNARRTSASTVGRPAGRKAAGKKARVKGPGRRKGARRGRRPSVRSAGSSDPVRQVLTDSYRDKRDALEAAMDKAFDRSIRGDSVQGINEFLSSIDRSIGDFEKV